ncbi:larval cuticle protein A2B-like [Leptinotarsa decemlineata]|uniref:larval cuticle protein A2B-like n=1 Tax=Leptinotarsa decemlineata TaxID=7539 RepID=UPI003D304155
MAIKFIILTALVALARGSVIGAPAAVLPAPSVLAKISDATFDPNPSYSYAYDVQDALTGDSKTQVESRANNIVRGQYTVADPDGTRRVVDYYADPIHGFNAVVRKLPLAVAAAPVVARAVAPAVTPVARAVAAPFVAPVAAPVARAVAAPVLPAPFARVASPYVAAPALAPGIARVAAPYVGAPAPLAFSPGWGSPYSLAPAPAAVL